MRHLALEFLVSVVEASPAMCRKMERRVAGANGGLVGSITVDGRREVGKVNGVAGCSFAAVVIPVCFAMMTEVPVRQLRRAT